MIEVTFPPGITDITAPSLYQWDYGQVLKISGLNLPSITQVHFCDRTCDKTIVRLGTVTDGNLIAAIPDILLENQYSINAFIYTIEENAAKTIRWIHIPVIARKKPEDFIDQPTPAEQTMLEEMIQYVNAAMDESGALVQEVRDLYSETITVQDLKDMIAAETGPVPIIMDELYNPLGGIILQRFDLSSGFVEFTKASPQTVTINVTPRLVVNKKNNNFDYEKTINYDCYLVIIFY